MTWNGGVRGKTIVGAKMFGLDVPRPEPRRPELYAVDTVGLSMTEKRTLVNLAEYPHATDAQIAQVIGKSRQTVTKVRKRLERKGMFTRACIPLRFTWNIDFTANVHMRFKPDLDEEVRASLSKEGWISLSWYTMERDSEAYTTHMNKDYGDYSTEMQRMMKSLMESDVLRGDPHTSLVSTAAAKELRDCNYAPMVRKSLDLSSDDLHIAKFPRVRL